ncbi:hypothetical protein LOTGIDRAFT_230504 [Lottia gigantea]|uniref:Uncharacterized protein n=1 Tax=Lottia gigantea TaxID=225164 RepID=V4AGB8_LOTGI|nr:hypothetical protein LOTGIDRAFT_230504 [Lottia gigantea]ESP03089.1 hypothetical protein LOTGIDRAFT_230504 [Lottia gigantea]
MDLSIIALFLVLALVPIIQTNSLHDDTIEAPRIRMKPQFKGIKTRIISRSKSPRFSEIHDKHSHHVLRDQPKSSASRSTKRLLPNDYKVNRRRFRTSSRNNRQRTSTKITDYLSANNQIVQPLDLHGIPTQYKSLSSRSKGYREKYEKPKTYEGNSLKYTSLQNDEVRSHSKRGVIIGGPLGSKGEDYISQPKIISRVYKPGSNEPIVTWVVGKPTNVNDYKPPIILEAAIPGANLP